MSTFLFILLCVVVSVVVMSHIPGLEHFVKPVVELFFGLLKVLSENGFAWLIFAVKGLFSAHAELIEHLIKEPKEIDPTAEIRNGLK